MKKHYRASKKVPEEKEFEALCKKVKTILKDIGNEILKGIVKILPSKKSKPCEYCDFSNVCRKIYVCSEVIKISG